MVSLPYFDLSKVGKLRKKTAKFGGRVQNQFIGIIVLDSIGFC